MILKKDILRKRLSVEFEIKELGKLKYFLGIEVTHSKKEIFISQQKYILDLLKEIKMVDCKPCETPIDLKHDLIMMRKEPQLIRHNTKG
jgi:Asp-tRNA(Asn)/Glu-tRNA(Gln) amidotransferase C subunit